MYCAPTLEVRITDASSSRQFLAELATFVAAFTHHTGSQELTEITPTVYKESLTNRWAAARSGMQATFRWDGVALPVASLVGRMLDEAADELKVLGASRSDLATIDCMTRKRICQADFVRHYAERYPDPIAFASVYGKLLRGWDVVDEYLEGARPLDPVPPVSDEEILAEHAGVIGEGTHFYKTRHVMWYPPVVADEIVRELIERRRISIRSTENMGVVLSQMLATE